MEKGSFLSFIEHLSPLAALNAKKMEELLFEDSASAIVKSRLFLEKVLDEVFKMESIEAPYVSSLYEKISYLSKEGIIKRDTQKLFDTIRINGNKAAHTGDFADLSQAIGLHKVMYKVDLWFYELYSQERVDIPPYEQPKPTKSEISSQEQIDELIQKQLIKMLEERGERTTPDPKEVNPEGEEILVKDLPKNKSYLLRELRRLSDSAQEAIENANAFSHFKKYMHVDRKIQKDLEYILEKNKQDDSGKLILLCGSVGDGKSHLLAYLKKHKPELISDYEIHNDATESFSPDKDAMETLAEVLKDFSDQRVESSNKRVILAINMGVLHNFITADHGDQTYHELSKFVDNSDLFSQNVTTHYSEEAFDLLSFGDYHPFEITNEGPQSQFFLSILNNIFKDSNDNPFHLALKEDQNNGIRTMLHENFEFMRKPFVQKQVVDLIIQTLIRDKMVISARAFLNFIADILIPDRLSSYYSLTEFQRLELNTTNLLFNRMERSPILKAMGEKDPIHQRSYHIDQLIINLNTYTDYAKVFDRYIQSDEAKKWLEPFKQDDSVTGHSFSQLVEVVIRLAYLTNEDFSKQVIEENYLNYVKYLYAFNAGEKSKIRDFYEEMKQSIFKWNGTPKKEYIYINNPAEKFRIAQLLNFKPTYKHLNFNHQNVLESFKTTIHLRYHDGNGDNQVDLEIDYPLYNLLTKVQQGYCPNKKDKEDAIKFVEFMDRIMGYGKKKDELLVQFPADERSYKLKRDDFGDFVFEKES
ncbi:DNA phosphorothioation-dependent restriction protein DptF [Guptibacillus hwajinpoensis]|uniref:DNA phosphorothioation-dependent restriction protein DptF n=1 Tax=Guptibacillus hwajinpoensis TaxID=208199 RepID=UPI00273D34A6|nr:DNA phosphorothioation-dependent restriction protein DptF [Pseudalkalibacillus hwajinpoensis]WLR59117.1 DNA phosphorothioation-dependent restriction protein DptF [Pseudalkalibacillus hwajinpoensis]